MSVRKQTVSFTEPAFAYALSLVEAGEYASVSAAVSGEMARAKATRESQAALFEAEIARRIALPEDQWEPVGELSDITAAARARLAELRGGKLMRQIRHPLVNRDVMGIFEHVLTTTRGDLAAAERRLDEIDALLREITSNPRSGQRLSGALAGWLARHGGRDHKLTIVFRPEPEADVLRVALIAFGGRDWLAVAESRRG